MRRVALLTLVLIAGLSYAGNPKTPRIIDGKSIVPGPAFQGSPLIEIVNLKFYRCMFTDGGAPCTVILGEAISHLGHDRFNVLLDFALYGVSTANYPGHLGTVRVKIERPKPNQRTRFYCLAPSWYREEGAFHGYTIAFHIELWRPPKPEPLE